MVSNQSSETGEKMRHPLRQQTKPSILLTLFLACQLSHQGILVQASSEPVNYVTCGSVIKLKNDAKPNIRLNSHDVKYGSGSGQQSVTGVDNKETSSYWSVQVARDKVCHRGDPIECGSIIRLQHEQTRRYLHSHLFKSPMSSQQEVSAFGGDNDSDTGDHWTVYCKSRYWQKGEPMRLKHVDTSTWLALSGNSYGRPISGHLEVIAATTTEASSYWQSAEGIFVQPDKQEVPAGSRDEL